MTAREIEIFRSVMHCRSLMAAADMLHVTQPALSKALRHCEDRLGYQLFHRRGGRLVPTAEANALLLDADRVHAQIQGFSALARSVSGRLGGVLRVGATSSLASSLIPRALAALQREFTQAHIVLHMLPVPELEPALLARRVDLGGRTLAPDGAGSLGPQLGRGALRGARSAGAPLGASARAGPGGAERVA